MAKRKISSRKILKFSLRLLIIFFLILFIVICFGLMEMKPVGGNREVAFEVTMGSTYTSIASSLKEKKLIRSSFVYKIYLKWKKPQNLKAGIYTLNSNMSLSKIIDTLSGNPKEGGIQITFKEGLNMRQMVFLFTEKMNYHADDIYNTLKDTAYLKQLIQDYWFLTDDILNPKLYYSLEGYLYPDTYQFKKKATIKETLKVMLDNTEKKLEPYRKSIVDSGKSIHSILTMASILELEAVDKDSRKDVAGVFYNRLKEKMNLGSDVTAYYAAKINLSERDLYKSELNDCNDYNTRCSRFKSLPIGPIASPSLESIIAALNPNEHKYLYFVADKNKKTYFSETYQKHLQTIQTLKDQKLWYEY